MGQYRGFGDLIRGRRKELGYRLDQVAEKVGWSIPYLSELERGIKQPPEPSIALDRLAAALKLSVSEVKHEARLSRRFVQIGLEDASRRQRELAVLLARRFEQGLSDQEADAIMQQLENGDVLPYDNTDCPECTRTC